MSKEIKVPEKVVYVCNGKTCKKRGGKELRKFFKKALDDEGNIVVIKTGCTDNCKNAPIVCVQPENRWYAKTTGDMATEIVRDLTSPERPIHFPTQG